MRWWMAVWVVVGLTPLVGMAEASTMPVFTPEMADLVTNGKVALDTVWVLIAAFLVFFMNLGFAMVESGLCRAKNTVNILAKNFIVFAISSIDQL